MPTPRHAEPYRRSRLLLLVVGTVVTFIIFSSWQIIGRDVPSEQSNEENVVDCPVCAVKEQAKETELALPEQKCTPCPVLMCPPEKECPECPPPPECPTQQSAPMECPTQECPPSGGRPPIPPPGPVPFGCMKPFTVDRSQCARDPNGDMKIFVYNFTGTDVDLPNAEPANGMYDTEFVVYKRILESTRYLTTDPNEADWFYAHIPTAHLVHGGLGVFEYGNVFNFVKRAYQVMLTQFPWFRRQLGADHIITFSHDIGSAYAPFELHNCVFIQHNGDLNIKWQEAFAPIPKAWANTEFVERLGAPFFNALKDIIIPPYVEFTKLRSGDGAMDLNADRPRLAYLRGSINAERGYSRGVRQWMFKAFKDDPDIEIAEGFSEPTEYVDDMMKSKFCFAPAGHAVWSPRMVFAIMAGCVPVIIADYAEHPWERVLDYDKFAVRLRRDEAMPMMNSTDGSHLKNLLLKIVESGELKKKQLELSKVWPLFHWGSPYMDPDVYGNPKVAKDAFDMLMDELKWKKSLVYSRKTKPICFNGEVLEVNYNYVPVCGREGEDYLGK